MPGNAGPLRRRPSTRLDTTETIGSNGQVCDRSSESASVNRPGLSAAKIPKSAPAIAASDTASCTLSAQVTSACAEMAAQAIDSSRPSVGPIHSTLRWAGATGKAS